MSARAACLVLVVATSVASAGCEDGRLRYAEDTTRLAASAITDVETSGGEDAQLLPLLERAHYRLGQEERSIEEWRDHGGPLAFATHAPCLRNALIALREYLIAHERPVPTDLDSAEAMLAEVATHDCEP
ncbi:MAG: hypothetical protein U0234_21560 [Sandaracinus sp.]